VVLDENLIAEAFKYAENIHARKELRETALKEFVNNRMREKSFETHTK
jgi:hypothetical protein